MVVGVCFSFFLFYIRVPTGEDSNDVAENRDGADPNQLIVRLDSFFHSFFS